MSTIPTIRLSKLNVQTARYSTVTEIDDTVKVTLPSGQEWDLSVDSYSGNLHIYNPSGRQIVVMPIVSNAIEIKETD